MKKSPGRPKKIVKRERTSGIRLTKTEDFIIRNKAAKAGLSFTNYIRKMAIYGELRARFTDEERQFVRQLIGMSGNLNQLTKAAHKEGLLQAILYFEGYRDRIDELLNHLQHDK
jgi:Bacterial mobilisation protein (MobC)